MPPSGFNKRAVDGILLFIRECYLDLLQEVEDGKHTNFPEAIEYELGQIQKVLADLHIDDTGRLVRRR